MFLSESKFFQVYCEQKNFFYTKIRIFKMRNVKTTYKVKKILNILFVLLYVVFATSSSDIPLISAIFLATYLTFIEVFLFPLCGSGDIYGESVSIKILSNGTSETQSSGFEFLNVITPLNDM